MTNYDMDELRRQEHKKDWPKSVEIGKDEEPWVAVDICENYLKYRMDLMKKVAEACLLDWKYFLEPKEDEWRFILTTNVAAQISMCRLHYRRVPKRLPKTLEEQAKYWKDFYNTAKGAGTPEKFLETVKKYG